ncbi:beta-1,3-galactosyl-O-glycosyl-glycoprotein beta-1,6-N-acetylglucosaminyltransferase 3-like [Ostrea edulis]|uniref:beta-1,3-galactosyl-O-glycosyl-glycoprotein beta-1,6-N-acetylglucosaminyltransferase 3-like n=1 Tax=Ostrea edulis TaxID=37623 RepID=UPI0024AFD02A|nr:beta-1,3-galactosyl-O-glycosyl-glycoprotein beta-1,6-N-acetylglucosaminyltransferase 3-like [Ostrea edulis]
MTTCYQHTTELSKMDVRKLLLILTSFVILIYVMDLLRLFQISASSKKVMTPNQRYDIANIVVTDSGRIPDDRFNMASENHRRSQLKRIVHKVDCQQIIDGDEEYILLANATMYKQNYTFPTDKDIGDIAQNCEKFLGVYNYKYFFVSPEERGFPIAYSILTYKDAFQTEKLLRAIYRPHNLYCIHVDKSPDTGWLLYAMKSIANCLPNVFIASKLEDVIYAEFSRLKADLNCMSDLLNNTDVKWRYVINLPSQEFPLKTNLEIVKILKIFNGTSSVDSDYDKNTLYRYKETYTVKHGKLESTGKKKDPPPYDIIIGKGIAYGVFSRDFVNYSINDAKAQGILKWLEDTYSPDESFWATLVFNKHLNVPGVNDSDLEAYYYTSSVPFRSVQRPISGFRRRKDH